MIFNYKKKFGFLSLFSIIFSIIVFTYTLPLGLEVSLSFLLLLVVFVWFNFYCESFFSITNVCISIFYTLFFILAPVIQLSTRYFFINTIPYDTYLIVSTNLLLSLFLLIFLATRILIDNHSKLPFTINTKNIYKQGNKINGPIMIFVSFIIILIAYLNGHFEIISNIINLVNEEEDDVNQIYSLITVKFLYSIPVVGLLCYLSKNWKKYFLPLFIISIFVIILKNPLVEHRNGYGLIYLACFWFAFASYINSSSKLYSFILIIFAIFFPLGAMLNPKRFISEQFNFQDLFINYYNTLNYDSWANVAGSIEYVSREGLQYGYQLLSTILFWFPRSIWEDKGVASGQLLGEFMEQKYSMWITNISFPIISEGYVDFGILGVVIYASIFAIISSKLDIIISQTKKPEYLFLALLTSFSYIFLIRGPLLSSLAYTVGVALAMYLSSKLFKKSRMYL